MSEEILRSLFVSKAEGADIALIEGNRGLFDGRDVYGQSSTASLATLLNCPVLLIIDCTKMTRTVAALVQGCLCFAPDINILGVVFNQTSGKRHRTILRQCVENYTDVPVMGALPRLDKTLIPERHMGLISDQEYPADRAIDTIASFIKEWVDTERIFTKADVARHPENFQPLDWPSAISSSEPVSIGIVKDSSLWFYYPENLEALQRAGAKLVEVSLVAPDPWPEIQGLYLGGGFPETQADLLSRNTSLRHHILWLSQQGLPIYAECGGLMYLCESLGWMGEMYPMVGVFPFHAELYTKPQGHGYTELSVIKGNPFYAKGLRFRGHEFHYSRCCHGDAGHITGCLDLTKGVGIEDGQDGILSRNTFACYTHIHALSVPEWATNFVRAAALFQESMRSGCRQCADIIA
jgi:cobyrinic acid a,c-diamide synthase